MFQSSIFAQECGCIDCPVTIEDQNISTATFAVADAANGSLTTNKIKAVFLKFTHSYPAELEMKLISPAGQAVTLIGPLASSASGIFFGGFNISFVSDVTATNPDPGMSNIWDNEDLSGLNQYKGAYLPHSGSLLNFNTGTLIGEWKLEISDPQQFDFGLLQEFNIVFEDQEGINCCEADAGTIANQDVVACPNAEELLLDISTDFNGSVPSSSVYGYTYFVSVNDLLVGVAESPDLRMSPPGVYQIYGFSYELFDQSQLPIPNGIITINEIQTLLSLENPLICGDLTDNFLEITILEGDTETFLMDTICEGASVFFGIEEIFESGIYRDTFPLTESCDSIVTLDLMVAIPDTLFTSDQTCNLEEVGMDTIFLINIFECDSLVITEYSLTPSDTTYLNEETCDTELDGMMDTLTISTPSCDSVVITNLFYELPDTTFAFQKTCEALEIGFDTISVTVEGSCDDIQIIETGLYLNDTTFLVAITCDSNAPLEQIETFPTDSCDRVEVTNFTYSPPDTTFLSSTTCDPSLEAVDTLYLFNLNGCDSLIITDYQLIITDTTRLEEYSCDIQDVGIDTAYLQNQNLCDSLIISTTLFSTADTTFLSAFTCDVNQVEPLVEAFETAECDSIVITNFVYAAPDTTYVEQGTCDEAQTTDTTILQNQLACDSFVITTYIYLADQPIEVFETTCDVDQVGTTRDTLSGEFCDSIVWTTYSLLLSDTVNIIDTTCDEAEVGIDSLLLINVQGCDSLVITSIQWLPIEPTLSSEFTCDQNQVGLDTTILLSYLKCDSLVIIDFVLSESDTTFLPIAFTCDPQAAGLDTIVFTTASCDSVVISNTEWQSVVPTNIEDLTCDPSQVGSDTSFFTSYLGCDSLVIIDYILGQIDTTYAPIQFSCDPTEALVDTINFAGVDCDSVVVVSTVYEPIEDTYLEMYTCDILQIGLDTSIFNSIQNCDSLVITSFLLSESDTTFSPIVYTCLPSEVGIDTTLFSSADCDSLVISVTELSVLDTTIILDESCTQNFTTIDTINYNSSQACDSVVIITTLPLNASESYSEVFVQNQAEVTIDTVYLTNAVGCDSLVITNYILIDDNPSDTSYVNIPTCNEGLMPDTILFPNGDVQISVPELFTLDTTYIQETTCDDLQLQEEVLNLISAEGCDSVLVINYELIQIDTIQNTIFACSDLPQDTLIISGLACPTIQINTHVNASSDTSYVETVNCVAPFGLDTVTMTNIAGCDSVAITNIIEASISETNLIQSACLPDLPNDTLFLNGVFCDSLVIINYEYEEILPTVFTEETCNAWDVEPDTLTLVSAIGCDSLIITQKVYNPIQPIEVNAYTCDQNLLGTVSDTLTSMTGCDSILITTYELDIFGLSFEIESESSTCSGIDDGTVDIIVDESQANVLWYFDSSNDFSKNNLPAGEYLVQLNDGACDTVFTIVVASGSSIDIELDVDYIPCSTIGGKITVNPSGGIAPFTYLWDDRSTDSIRVDLQDGLYTVSVTDSRGCQGVAFEEILNVTGLDTDVEIVNVTCFGYEDGSINIDVLSGTPPYTVEWDDGSYQLFRENLPAGIYSVSIHDVNDCNVTLNRIMREPPLLALDLFINDYNEFEVVATGGVPPYKYLWNDGDMDPIIEYPINGFDYEVTVTDDNDCMAVIGEVFQTDSSISLGSPSIDIYPNPTSDVLRFTTAAVLPVQQLHMYDIQGRQVYTEQDFFIAADQILELPKLPTGAYFLEAILADGIFRKKIIYINDD